MDNLIGQSITVFLAFFAVMNPIANAAFSVLCVITFLAFLSGDRLVRILGRSGMDVVTRLMGLIMAVVGTQMLIQGIHGAKDLF